jgi:Co/Zn/Cd efflux system component
MDSMVSDERPVGESGVGRPGGAPEAIVPVPSAADTQSQLTVWVAFAANLLIAAAKSVAALLTGSASMVAESAHSWADTGNEVFLVIANKRSRRPPEPGHSLGFGREAYVWSLFAAMGLLRRCRSGMACSSCSTHGQRRTS